MKKAIVVAVSAVTAVCAIAASVATADSSRVASPAAPSCKQALIALTGPYTGPAGTAGLDPASDVHGPGEEGLGLRVEAEVPVNPTDCPEELPLDFRLCC